jgi:type IV pilus assembly protein PilM
MLFAHKSIGLEIFHDGIALVLASGKQSAPQIERYEVVRFPGDVIKPSLKDVNILEAAVLRNALSAGYEKLSTKIKRVSLSIPDAAGRVLLVDVDMPLKNKAEGMDHVRWKLKKSFPIDLNDVHLDYQVIRQETNGSSLVLVGLVSKVVINEYEEILLDIGLEPEFIDFSSFNLHRLFSPRLEINDHMTFISLYRGSLSVHIFQDGCLDFSRHKLLWPTVLDPARLYREINSSLVVYSDTKGGWKPRTVCYYAATDERAVLRDVLLEVLGAEPVLMDTDALVNSARQSIDRNLMCDVVSALGAASRSLK